MTLPDGWEVICVNELAGPTGIVSDGDWVESKDQDPTGGVRLTQLADVGVGDFRNRSARFMTREAAKRLKCTYLAEGDVLIARMPDPIGRACVFPGLEIAAVTAVDVMIWRTDGSLASADWLVGVLNSPDIQARMAAEAGGTTRQRIAGGRIKTLMLPTPPLAEQGRIVAKLDTLIARIDLGRTALEHVRKLAKRIRQSALEQIFSSSGDIPTVRLGDLCKVGTGATPKRGESKYYAKGNIAWVTSKEVNKGIVKKATVFLTEVAISETNCKIYPAGSLMLALYGEGKTRGKVATLDIDAATNQALAVLHDFHTDKVTTSWVKLFLEARYEVTREEAAGGVQPNLNLGVVKEIEIPIPSILDQQCATLQIEAYFARADRLEAEAALAVALLDRLEASFLAKAFRGELVPQDSADEPTSTLLDRIRVERVSAPKPRHGRGSAVPVAAQ